MPSTGMQEGSHPLPTGVIPRIVTELGLRGQRLDLSIFKRPLDRTL
jgi:hypothetical protein